MALRDSYVSDLKNVPKKNRIFVMRHRGHDSLAPPEDLFRDFKARETELKKAKVDPVSAHNRAWDDVGYDKRFGEAFWSNPDAIAELKAIAALAAEGDVTLICYEKPPKRCHRQLLVEYAKRLLP